MIRSAYSSTQCILESSLNVKSTVESVSRPLPEYQANPGGLPLDAAHIHPLQGVHVELPDLVGLAHEQVGIDAHKELLLLRRSSYCSLFKPARKYTWVSNTNM